MENYKVKLPGHKDTSYSGLIKGTKFKYFFYFLKQDSRKFVIWLNGGPGCTSMDGLFLEHGPFRFNITQDLVTNPYSWDSKANVLYLDQPSETGYSTGSLVTSMEDLLANFDEFIQKFLDIFVEMKDCDLYVSGESFAGIYIPYIARLLIQKNYNLKGIMIGNGWIEPRFNYRAWIDFSVKHNLLGGSFLEKANRQMEYCQSKMKSQPGLAHYDTCETIFKLIEDYSQQGGQYCINKYDYTLRDSGLGQGCGNEWPPGLQLMTDYLNHEYVQIGLNVPDFSSRWVECNGRVYTSIISDNLHSSFEVLEEVVKKVNVILYSGMDDIICNYISTENMISVMNFNGDVGFKNGMQDWVVNNTVVGEINSERNLTFVKVYNASHMVPFDSPFVALELLSLLLSNDTVDNIIVEGDDSPSKALAIIFLVSVLSAAVFIGWYVQRKIRRTATGFKKLENEEEVENIAMSNL